MLRLPPESPWCGSCARFTTRTGQAVEVQDTVAAADKHQFRYEVTM